MKKLEVVFDSQTYPVAVIDARDEEEIWAAMQDHGDRGPQDYQG